jgi:hypothetical protein
MEYVRMEDDLRVFIIHHLMKILIESIDYYVCEH